MPNLNKERPQAIANNLIRKPVTDQCWLNSVAALQELNDPKLVYVEGYMLLDDGIITEHGWLVDTETNEIIDVTNYHNAEFYAEATRYDLQTVLTWAVGTILPKIDAIKDNRMLQAMVKINKYQLGWD